MKSVLISIQPKWCQLIANGRKTVEVRKTKPKLEAPFKCYIYCTSNNRKNALHTYINSGYGRKNFGVIGNWRSGKDIVDVNPHLPAYRYNAYLAEGKVIGEFTCDKIYDIKPHYDIPNFCNQYEYGWKIGEAEDCLSFEDLDFYLGGKRGYGWHIPNLVIYDEPKSLSKFVRQRRCYEENINESCSETCSEYADGECDGKYVSIRPPQSWCYVEEVLE